MNRQPLPHYQYLFPSKWCDPHYRLQPTTAKYTSGTRLLCKPLWRRRHSPPPALAYESWNPGGCRELLSLAEAGPSLLSFFVFVFGFGPGCITMQGPRSLSDNLPCYCTSSPHHTTTPAIHLLHACKASLSCSSLQCHATCIVSRPDHRDESTHIRCSVRRWRVSLWWISHLRAG